MTVRNIGPNNRRIFGLPVCAPGENPADYETLLQVVVKQHMPRGTEEWLVDKDFVDDRMEIRSLRKQKFFLLSDAFLKAIDQHLMRFQIEDELSEEEVKEIRILAFEVAKAGNPEKCVALDKALDRFLISTDIISARAYKMCLPELEAIDQSIQDALLRTDETLARRSRLRAYAKGYQELIEAHARRHREMDDEFYLSLVSEEMQDQVDPSPRVIVPPTPEELEKRRIEPAEMDAEAAKQVAFAVAKKDAAEKSKHDRLEARQLRRQALPPPDTSKKDDQANGGAEKKE